MLAAEDQIPQSIVAKAELINLSDSPTSEQLIDFLKAFADWRGVSTDEWLKEKFHDKPGMVESFMRQRERQKAVSIQLTEKSYRAVVDVANRHGVTVSESIEMLLLRGADCALQKIGGHHD